MSRLLSPRNILILVVALAVIIGSRFVSPVVLPTIILKPEPIPGLTIGSFKITNTLLATLLSDLTVLLLGFAAVRNMKEVPSGLQNLFEALFEAFFNFARDVLGPQAARVFPIAMTVFLLILASNWWERIPGFDSIGIIEPAHDAGVQQYKVGSSFIPGVYTLINEQGTISEEHAGEAGKEKAAEGEHGVPTEGVLTPFLRGVATDLNFTLALALIAFFYIQYQGFRQLGVGYLKKFFNFSSLVTGFVGILELVSEFAKIISFSFRLFGNIFAGTVLLFVMQFLIPWGIPSVFGLLEVGIGLIQALVFAVLILVFTAGAMESHDDHEAHIADVSQAMEGAEQVAHAASH